MKIIEKYIDNELNPVETFLLRSFLILNKAFKEKVEYYKSAGNELKCMFLIQYAEKELLTDENLKNEDFFNELAINERKSLSLFE